MAVVELVNWLFTLLYLAILIRVILSVIIPLLGQPNAIVDAIYRAACVVTEPILAPIRRIVPTVGMFDLSPTIALLLLVIIQYILVSQL